MQSYLRMLRWIFNQVVMYNMKKKHILSGKEKVKMVGHLEDQLTEEVKEAIVTIQKTVWEA